MTEILTGENSVYKFKFNLDFDEADTMCWCY